MTINFSQPSHNKDNQVNQITPNSDQVHYSGKLLAKNTIYNFLGYFLPFPVGVVAIPYLIKGIGVPRFGVLSIVWMMIGYFMLFDFGIGRTATKFVSELWAQKKYQEVLELVVASTIILLGCGIVVGLLLALLTNWVVTSLIHIPADLVNETRQAFYMLSIGIPVMLLIIGARGVLEALQQFRIINLIKIPSSIATFIIPLLVMLYSKSLYPIVAMLVLGKLLTLLFLLYYCWKYLPFSNLRLRLKKSSFTKLLRFGGWLSISNIVAPLMGKMDRFYIGTILTISAVTYYVAPFDMMTKLFLIPVSLLGVVFPVFSAYSVNNSGKFSLLHQRAVKYILIIMTPIVFILIVYAQPILKIWLGEEFALQSTLVMQLIAAGVLFSSIAKVPFNALQAYGRPDIVTKLILIELPIYLVILFFLTKFFGIVGTAVIWSLRRMMETNIIFILAYSKIPSMKFNLKKESVILNLWIITSVLVAYGLSLVPNLFLETILMVAVLSLIFYLSFVFWLDSYEQLKIKKILLQISSLLYKMVTK